MSTMYNFWKNIRWFGEFLLLFGLFLMSLYTFTCSFYGCFVLSIHLNNYVADQNKSHCYFCSLVTFTYAWVFFPVATVRILKNILCLYTDTVIGEFQKRYKTTRINCNEFLLLLNFIEFFFCLFVSIISDLNMQPNIFQWRIFYSVISQDSNTEFLYGFCIVENGLWCFCFKNIW